MPPAKPSTPPSVFHVAAFAGLVLAGVILLRVSPDARQAAAQAAEPPYVSTGDDVLTAGREIHVDQEVAGDVAAAGADIDINANVGGYVMSAGRNVSLNANVGNDLWAAGEVIDVTGTIGNNAMIAGRMVTLHPGASVDGDARLAGRSVTAMGHVSNDLVVAGSTVAIGGEVGGMVNARGSHVTVLPNTVINGDLVVHSPEPPDIAGDARILGTVRHEVTGAGAGGVPWALVWLWSFAALACLAVAAFLVAPSWPGRVNGVLAARPATSFLVGMAIAFVLPAVAIPVAFTMVGLPLAVVALSVYVAMLVLSVVLVSFRVGNWLLFRVYRAPHARALPMLLGLVVLTLLMSLPFVGIFIVLFAVAWGLGAIALERRSLRSPARVPVM